MKITQETIDRVYEDTLRYLFENRKEIERRYGNKSLAVLIDKSGVRIVDSDDDESKLIEREQAGRGKGVITYTNIRKAVQHFETLRRAG